jgi:hypothetical protein
MLVSQLAHDARVVAHYGLDPGLDTTYEMIVEIRAQHGWDFLWDAYAPDDSAVVLSDELDDICCESRAWFTAGSEQPYMVYPMRGVGRPAGKHSTAGALAALTWIAYQRNLQLGATVEPPPVLSIPPLPWNLLMVDQHWVFTYEGGRPFMSTRTHHPRGTQICERTQKTCELIRDIANAP